MTKAECLAKLGEKMTANMNEVRRQLEFIAELPGHEIHHQEAPGKARIDLLQQLSTTWKEGQALRELAVELVGLVYPPDAQWSTTTTIPGACAAFYASGATRL